MNKRGFTLVEVLASIVILSVIIGIGVVSYQSIMKRVEKKYYETLEQDLLMAGSDYFNNHREDKPFIGYNSVDITSLIGKEYIETLNDRHGNVCGDIDDENSRVYIYKTDTGYDYEACLVCSDYRSTGAYCKGVVEGVININAVSNEQPYNVLLSYSNTNWTNDTVSVTFSMANEVSRYDILNLSSKEERSCTDITNNSCTISLDESASYQVSAFNGETKIATKDFNLKVDKVIPTVSYTLDAGFYNSNSITLNVLPSDDLKISSYDVLVNNYQSTEVLQSYNNQTSSELPITLTGEGRYDVLTQVRDMAGNVNIPSSGETVYNKYYRQNYIIDTTAPVCTWTEPTGDVGINKTATFTLVCKDTYTITEPPTLTKNNFKVLNEETYKITNVTGPTAVTGGQKYIITIKGLATGATRIRLLADSIADRAGNFNVMTPSELVRVTENGGSSGGDNCKYRFEITYTCGDATLSGNAYSSFSYNSYEDAMSACYNYNSCGSSGVLNRTCTTRVAC